MAGPAAAADNSCAQMMPAHSSRPQAISFVNARMGKAGLNSLRIVQPRIQSIGEGPAPGDLIVDLRGDRLLPGMINSHDHLQLNGFPRRKYRDRYDSAREWIADVEQHRDVDTELVACQSMPRRTRQFHGGLKNILSGVTTVAHHDPLYDDFFEIDYPVRVVRNLGWSHSLLIDGEDRVTSSYQRTPTEWPWIIHAAEGVDVESTQEVGRLDALGCLAANTLIVHGVGMDECQQERLAAAGAGVIWCPSSNLHLFGATLNVARLAAQGRVALGTDSRMTGGRDLLAELCMARGCCTLSDDALESMVTEVAARLLRLGDRGTLAPGMLADVLILPGSTPLHKASRADIRLVMVNGEARIGDARYVRLLAPAAHSVQIELDSCPKLLNRGLATQLAELTIREPGMELCATSWRAA